MCWHGSKRICVIICVTSGWDRGFLLFLLAGRREGTFALESSLVWAATRQHGGESTRSRANTNSTRIHEKRLHCRLQPGTNKFEKRHGFWQIFVVFHSTHWQKRYKTLSVCYTANTDIRCPIMATEQQLATLNLATVCSSRSHPIKKVCLPLIFLLLTQFWKISLWVSSLSKKDDVKVISRGDVLPKNIGWECAVRFARPSHHWRTKSTICPTLFMISWPKIRYSI